MSQMSQRPLASSPTSVLVRLVVGLVAVAFTASGCGGGGRPTTDAAGTDAFVAAPGGLFITALDQALRVVPGVTITTDPPSTSAVTDALGTALLRDLAPGFYAVTGVHPTMGAGRAPVKVVSGMITEVSLSLRPVDVRGIDAGGGAADARADAGKDAPNGAPDARDAISLSDASADAVVSSDGGGSSVTVTLAAPTKDTNGINLSWTLTPGTVPTSFRIYRSSATGGAEIVNIVNDAKATTYRDETAKLGVAYTYRVGAVLSTTLEVQSNAQMITAGVFIAVDTQVGAMVVDRKRPYLYAVDTVNNSLLFVNTTSNSLEKTIFIGSRPVDLDINPAGTELYVANFGATEIAVVNLETREKARALAVDTQVGTWDGNPYRLACTVGDTLAFTSMDQWNDIKLVNALTGANLDVQGSFYAPDLVASPDGTHLYVAGDGLTRYDVGNKLSAADSLSITSSVSGHLSVTGDDKYLFVGNQKLLTKNLKSALGTFAEAILLTNGDGSVAIGAQHVFDGNTFAITRTLPLSSQILALSNDEATLYLYDQMTSRIYLYKVR